MFGRIRAAIGRGVQRVRNFFGGANTQTSGT